MLPLHKPEIQITILDDRHTDECGAGCGIDWSLPESLALARGQIQDRFGDNVKLEYANTSMNVSAKSYSEAAGWKGEIRNKNLLRPLLLVDGKLRISGPFDIRQLMDTIEFEMEIRI